MSCSRKPTPINGQFLLDQLLSSGQSVLSTPLGNQALSGGAFGKPGFANFGTGMLAGGVLWLLLGDKRVRKFGGKALGALAFRACNNWKQQKAAAADSMEVASEIYLVSVLAVDSESFMERAYLDALAAQLKLPPDLRTQMEIEARQALAAA